MQETTKKSDRNLIKGSTGDWQVVIGLEVHAQVASNAKLFSGASTAFGGAPNSHVSLVDAAMPGMLPVINQACIDQAVRTGLGLKARINLTSVFDRKNYFYPDLPQGYQISQYKSPIVGEGEVEVSVDGETHKVGIERLHLEQDAGKSIHDQHPDYSYVDLNRSGVALMEIVSKPDMRSAKQAQAYVSQLRSILRYLGTCDGDMEKGNLRADVNVSVRRAGDTEFGTRCEIKNVNSIRFIGQAIEVEARRQIDLIEDGGVDPAGDPPVRPEQGRDALHALQGGGARLPLLPRPDLLPLEITQDYVEGLKKGLPELPDVKTQRFMSAYGLSAYDAGVLVAEKERAEYFEAMIEEGAEPKAAANWLVNEYLGRVNSWERPPTLPPMDWHVRWPTPIKRPWPIATLGPVGPEANAAIVQMVSSGEISGRIAKQVLDAAWERGPDADPRAYVAKEGLKQVSDTGAIEKAVDAVIAANPDKVADAKSNPKAIGWFVGQIMKSTGGKANPAAVNEVLKKKLGL